jgi:hypothetical protein
MSVVVVKWQMLPQPCGNIIGFTAVSWHGLIVDAIPVTLGAARSVCVDATPARDG